MGLISLNNRFGEINLILNEAKSNFETNDSLYKALCRSTQVLLSAHFEGYLKELIKNALEDINSYSTFKNSNSFLKRRLCEHFIIGSNEVVNKEKNLKVKELIEALDNLSIKFKREYFFYTENQNPKASVLDKISEQFGVKDFFKQLKKSNLDLIFSNTNAANIEVAQNIRTYLVESTENYPYTTTLNFLEIDTSKTDSDNLWDAFLSNLLKRRHDIAHGTEIDNSAGHTTIEADKVKVEILIYAFTAFICQMTNPILPLPAPVEE